MKAPYDFTNDMSRDYRMELEVNLSEYKVIDHYVIMKPFVESVNVRRKYRQDLEVRSDGYGYSLPLIDEGPQSDSSSDDR